MLSRGSLPTNNAIDTIHLGPNSTPIQFTLCDVANPCIFVLATAMGATGHETADEITANAALIARCKELRGKAAQLAGMCKEWEKVDEQCPALPMVVMVGPAPAHANGHVNGNGVNGHANSDGRNEEPHLTARLLLNNMCHDSMAGSGAMCTAACSRIPGSIVQQIVGQ